MNDINQLFECVQEEIEEKRSAIESIIDEKDMQIERLQDENDRLERTIEKLHEIIKDKQ